MAASAAACSSSFGLRFSIESNHFLLHSFFSLSFFRSLVRMAYHGLRRQQLLPRPASSLIRSPLAHTSQTDCLPASQPTIHCPLSVALSLMALLCYFHRMSRVVHERRSPPELTQAPASLIRNDNNKYLE